jgi:hypothetical protein
MPRPFNTKSFDPWEWNVFIDGKKIGGFDKESIFEAEPVGEEFVDEKGADGQTTRNFTHEGLDATVTIFLKQSSDSNILFDALRRAKKIFPAKIEYAAAGTGGTKIESAEAYILSWPKITGKNMADVNEWKFKFTNVDPNIIGLGTTGGNTTDYS